MQRRLKSLATIASALTLLAVMSLPDVADAQCTYGNCTTVYYSCAPAVQYYVPCQTYQCCVPAQSYYYYPSTQTYVPAYRSSPVYSRVVNTYPPVQIVSQNYSYAPVQQNYPRVTSSTAAVPATSNNSSSSPFRSAGYTKPIYEFNPTPPVQFGNHCRGGT